MKESNVYCVMSSTSFLHQERQMTHGLLISMQRQRETRPNTMDDWNSMAAIGLGIPLYKNIHLLYFEFTAYAPSQFTNVMSRPTAKGYYFFFTCKRTRHRLCIVSSYLEMAQSRSFK